MELLAITLTVLVALLHYWFMALEMFLWTKPAGIQAFKLTPEFARESAVLAANQGLYNGFLATGLLVSFLLAPVPAATLRTFTLACVVVAGIFGGFTASKRIFLIQALPAALALGLWLTL